METGAGRTRDFLVAVDAETELMYKIMMKATERG
jgi:hypothetical protein